MSALPPTPKCRHPSWMVHRRPRLVGRAYLVGDSAVGARVHEGVGHDDPQRRPEGPLRAEAHRDLGVGGEIGAVDALYAAVENGIAGTNPIHLPSSVARLEICSRLTNTYLYSVFSRQIRTFGQLGR